MNGDNNNDNGTYPFNQHSAMIMDGLSHPSNTQHHFHSSNCKIRRMHIADQCKPFCWKRQIFQRYCFDWNNDRLSSSNTWNNKDKELDGTKS